MSFFEELKKKIHSTHNSNFHFDRINWAASIWIRELCNLVDEKYGHLDKPKQYELKCNCDGKGNPNSSAGCPIHGIKY